MEYKVSIRLMTYNHEKYIAQSIESVLSQKTNFPIELVIGDDKSTDNTLKIAQEYQNTQNVTIKILDRINNNKYSYLRKKRGRLHNWIDILNNCSGQYVALLDGDDYWTDSNKLQKQIDFLDANPNFSICFHNALLTDENNNPIQLYITDADLHKGFPEFIDLFKRNFIPTASCVFRNTGIKVPAKFYKSPFADWPLFFMLAEHGDIKYMDETMSVYRIHSGGLWNKLNLTDRYIQCVKCLKICNKLLKGRWKKYFYAALVPYLFELSKIYKPINSFASFKYSLKLLSLQKYNKDFGTKKG